MSRTRVKICGITRPQDLQAAVAAGADGLIVEVIGADTDREAVRCDGVQGIRPNVLGELIAESR